VVALVTKKVWQVIMSELEGRGPTKAELEFQKVREETYWSDMEFRPMTENLAKLDETQRWVEGARIYREKLQRKGLVHPCEASRCRASIRALDDFVLNMVRGLV